MEQEPCCPLVWVAPPLAASWASLRPVLSPPPHHSDPWVRSPPLASGLQLWPTPPRPVLSKRIMHSVARVVLNHSNAVSQPKLAQYSTVLCMPSPLIVERSVLMVLPCRVMEQGLVATTPFLLPPVGAGSGWVVTSPLHSSVAPVCDALLLWGGALGPCRQQDSGKR